MDDFDPLDDEFDSDGEETILDKPGELLALHGVTLELFDTLKRWFGIGATVSLDLAAVDSAVAELGDPEMIAAMAMRKLQALHLLSMPGIVTSTDVVISIVNDLDRALLQAPSMYLERRADTTDWDAAFADLTAAAVEDDAEAAPPAADAADPEIEQFHMHHGALHEAVRAVVEAAEGQIRYFQ